MIIFFLLCHSILETFIFEFLSVTHRNLQERKRYRKKIQKHVRSSAYNLTSTQRSSSWNQLRNKDSISSRFGDDFPVQARYEYRRQIEKDTQAHVSSFKKSCRICVCVQISYRSRSIHLSSWRYQGMFGSRFYVSRKNEKITSAKDFSSTRQICTTNNR